MSRLSHSLKKTVQTNSGQALIENLTILSFITLGLYLLTSLILTANSVIALRQITHNYGQCRLGFTIQKCTREFQTQQQKLIFLEALTPQERIVDGHTLINTVGKISWAQGIAGASKQSLRFEEKIRGPLW